ncbi:hypothetical protein H9L39_09780 [Fusarium oxysporum f. sp. albedinis]|nr:hypothetical protein H9L39_09780 [Fusarium oxysporum f. sp. albedinis]
MVVDEAGAYVFAPKIDRLNAIVGGLADRNLHENASRYCDGRILSHPSLNWIYELHIGEIEWGILW